MVSVRTSKEGRRGCGFRKPGGMYLVCKDDGKPCGKLPVETTICPTCGAGIRPARGWTWVDGDALVTSRKCPHEKKHCRGCPLSKKIGRVGLLWIGRAFYKTPLDWLNESIRMGVSRRINKVPRGFVVGETWVLVAHREAVPKPCPMCNGSGKTTNKTALGLESIGPCERCDKTGTIHTPGIFHVFKPTAIEYVITGHETADELEAIVKRGLTPVKVVPVDDETADGRPGRAG